MLIGALPSMALAWNHQGHAYVGAIADRLLTESARSHVQALIGVPLSEAAKWPDCVKSVSDKTFTFNPNDPFNRKACAVFATPGGIARMVDYAKRNSITCKPEPGEEICHKQYHYADVAIQHDHYDRSYVGTSDQDIVSAINAAISKLRGQPVPTPFSIQDDAEAIFMLAHFVGDLHQPLHVGVVYLDDRDQAANPDTPAGQPNPPASTRGGNSLLDPSRCGRSTHKCENLHAEWDTVPTSLKRDRIADAVLEQAREVALPTDPIDTWAAEWASETVLVSREAFKGLSFVRADGDSRHWNVEFQDRSAYLKNKNRIQRQQVIKAGARLAQVLNAVWP